MGNIFILMHFLPLIIIIYYYYFISVSELQLVNGF